MNQFVIVGKPVKMSASVFVRVAKEHSAIAAMERELKNIRKALRSAANDKRESVLWTISKGLDADALISRINVIKANGDRVNNDIVRLSESRIEIGIPVYKEA